MIADARPQRIAVIIPVYNGWDLTERCLDALSADARSGSVSEIVVVDDGSSDGTRELIVADPRVRAVLLERNHGFAGACNAGARAAKEADAFFFLNNDAFVRPGAIAELRAALADPSIGIAGPKLVYDDGTIQNAGMAFTKRGIEVLHYHLDGDLHDASIPRDYPAVTGAALLIRRTLFERLGGFDQAFANGVEDVDLALRAWRLGARVRYVPSSVIVHVEGATRGRTPADNDNHAKFWERSASDRRNLAAIAIPEPPLYRIDTRGTRSPDERAIARTLTEGLRRYGSAPVVAAPPPWGPVLAAIRARIEGRKIVAIAVGSTRHRADVLFTAPRDDVDAFAARAAPVRSWWTTTARARERLLAAGVPPGAVRLAFLGEDDAAGGKHRQRDGVAVYLDPNDTRSLVLAERVQTAVAPSRVVRIAVGSQTPESARDIVDECAIVIALAEDVYGTVIPYALASGAVVATAGDGRAPWCNERNALLADECALADAVARLLRDPVMLSRLAESAKRDAIRRLSLVHGIARVRELARALAHGTLDGSRAEIKPAAAARLRTSRSKP